MEYIYSAILGILQGLTEFLPISSSGHLAVFPDLLRMKEGFLDSLSFSVILHAGTLAAVVYYFRGKVAGMLVSFFKGFVRAEERKKENYKTGLFIIIATVPAVIAGLLLGDFIENKFRECNICIASMLVIFGLFLYGADRSGKKERKIKSMNAVDAVVIGLFQALALFPGVSRAGITMTAGLIAGYKREDAAEFSFLMSIPAIAGAVALEITSILQNGTEAGAGIMLTGFFAALVSGFFAIKFLMLFVKSHSFLLFAVYRAALGGIIIMLAAVGAL